MTIFRPNRSLMKGEPDMPMIWPPDWISPQGPTG